MRKQRSKQCRIATAYISRPRTTAPAAAAPDPAPTTTTDIPKFIPLWRIIIELATTGTALLVMLWIALQNTAAAIIGGVIGTAAWFAFIRLRPVFKRWARRNISTATVPVIPNVRQFINPETDRQRVTYRQIKRAFTTGNITTRDLENIASFHNVTRTIPTSAHTATNQL